MKTVKITEAKDNHDNKRYFAEIKENGETWKSRYFHLNSDIDECGYSGEFKKIGTFNYRTKEKFVKEGWFDELNDFVMQYGF